jgi:signal peptidase I
MKFIYFVSKIIVAFIIVLILLSMGFVGYRASHGDKLLSVQTNSMVPMFYAGDAVVTHKVSLENLHVGDVVTYRNPRDTLMVVSHRLVSVDYHTGRLITKGDALNVPDIAFPSYLVVGRVERVVPYMGFGLDWLHQPIGLIVLVYTPATFILVSEARRLARTWERPSYQVVSLHT